jgi:Zn-finger nucleic acid-binding protein
MDCPTCKIPLVMAERQGIEIDYCPTCRGIWLDRGELDKIIERSATIEQHAVPEAAPPQHRPAAAPSPSFLPVDEYRRPAWRGDHDRDHYDRGDAHRGHRSSYRGKRKSFLSDIFDFD